MLNTSKNVSVGDVVVVFGGYNACSTGYAFATVVDIDATVGGVVVKDSVEFNIDDGEYAVEWNDHFNAWLPKF